MDDVPISRGINIAGQYLSVDPLTGKLERNAKPFSKSSFDQIAPNHTVTIEHADGSKTLATIAGATHSQLRDADFVLELLGRDHKRDPRKVSNKQWHEFVVRLAEKHPDLVKVADSFRYHSGRPRPPVVVVASVRTEK